MANTRRSFLIGAAAAFIAAPAIVRASSLDYIPRAPTIIKPRLFYYDIRRHSWEPLRPETRLFDPVPMVIDARTLDGALSVTDQELHETRKSNHRLIARWAS